MGIVVQLHWYQRQKALLFGAEYSEVDQTRTTSKELGCVGMPRRRSKNRSSCLSATRRNQTRKNKRAIPVSLILEVWLQELLATITGAHSMSPGQYRSIQHDHRQRLLSGEN